MKDLRKQLLTQYSEPPPYLNETINPELLARLLPDKPNRLKHILGVTEFASEVGAALGLTKLEDVALAHDIGYANDLRRTGFHPLDGAIFLAHRGADADVIHAVLHHTGAREEAKHRPRATAFYESSSYQPTLLDKSITFCDTQTSPVGERVTIEERISEIEGRYGLESPPSLVMRRMQPEFMEIFDCVTALIALASSQQTGNN